MFAGPEATAFLAVTFGVLMLVSALASRASGRAGVPIVLGFLAVGMLAGREGVGGLVFSDYAFTLRLGTLALVLILFDGGLNTPMSAIRRAAAPAAVLATVGAALTAVLLALAAHFLFGFAWIPAMLLGAVVCSTDAASVFSVLRQSGLHLQRRVGATLEVESGLNDPLAVILTVLATESLVAGSPPDGLRLLEIPLQFAVGGVAGAALGYGGRLLLRHARLLAGGLYPVLTLALALVAYGLPTLLHGSGFLAVYVAAVVLGNAPMPYRSGVLRVHDALAWFAQVTMFLLLGLLVVPSHLLDVAGVGLGLGLVLALFARPLAVTLCLLPFHYNLRETAYVGWVGLRGAVPIILATVPVLARAPGAERLFDVVFFLVVVSALAPGATVGTVTRRLGLLASAPPPPPAVLEISSTQVLRDELHVFYVDTASAVCGASLADLPFPEHAAVMLVVRGTELVAPRGATVLNAGDHAYVFCRPEDEPFIRLLFGREEE